MSDNLPPLPPTSIYREGPYTDECMRAYAAQAVALERERCAQICHEIARDLLSNAEQDDYSFQGADACEEAIRASNIPDSAV